MPVMNPRDSVKSTWPLSDRSEWNLNQRIIHTLNAYPISPGKDVPVHPKSDKLPYFVEWQGHVWVLLHAFAPIAIHQALLLYTGQDSIHPILIFFLYFSTFSWTVVREVKAARTLGHTFGFLDGDTHERDGIPDVGVDKVVSSLWKTTGSRIVMVTCIGYNSSQSPVTVMADPYWWAWLYFQIGLYGIILDFWFYVYHRAMHDIDALWKYHRTHHLTKHPNSLLAAYADHEQEFFDMVGVPFLTWATFHAFGIPLGFYEWWICHQYIAFTEVLGHSGLRIYGMPPSTLTWLLRLFNAELVIEDHDLHHRKGYRKSHNYGKQTRVWDRLFGTCHDRIESATHNIDWDRGVYFPIF
ncbi:Alkylglycerol monooxygenase [Fusarium albosuccineum]|uniref:Alkylglycerol monooxygenase n=1 Tax=Fusarium albosuccineum TaxID=1237068 RepID=A0A8H4P1U8_9HYPO|nr:Alkylglycerol monooxygenase [Fusarium albosuccineum]